MSWRDEPLTELGREQAHHIFEQLEHQTFDVIYSSPLSRVVDSIKAVADAAGQTIMLDDRLKEVNFGEFIGQPKESPVAIFGRDDNQLLDSYDYDLTKYGGESAAQVKARVASFLDDLKKSRAQTVLVATHDGVFRWLYLLIDGKKVSRVPNATIHEFQF